MRRILIILLLLTGLTSIGTVGLHFITGADWLDCLYMTVITLTTVGYKEEMELGPEGKLFIICYLVMCLGIFTYSAYQLGQFVVSVQVRSLLEKRRMGKSIGRLQDHFVICGFGRMGATICEYLHHRGREFVVIDIDAGGMVPVCQEHGWLYIVGDATDDEVLIDAGIQRARSLTSVLPTDADNIYVVLSARMLAGKLQIIARASEEKAVDKLERAGATRVVSPFSSGAIKMARFMLTPSVEDFLEIADSRGNDLELADVQIGEGSPYVGRKLMDTDLSDKGVMVIGIRRANGDRLMPPPGSAEIRPGDCLFAFGSADAVNQMISESESGG